ncbi:ABC transporter permease [Paenibacillus sp. PDC88]|uniref:ABC transporter permease n=1 Tax=Paenibacillus sp. PDC88 TaxID=1884375 RepID=UPI000895F3AB|nr:ABC transporter permease subunit [Paenibacillus sp. PDC88]SDW74046.1 Cu-processing system permease protein [Paenibacillus sp. PDC88]
MRNMLIVARREIKMGFRNPWSYSFLILFSLFSLSLMFIHAQNLVEGYSGVTSSMLTLVLYLLPLMTLFIGSFSLTSEKEDGNWDLLTTYPLHTLSFIAGKYVGLSAVLFTIVAFGYGLMGLIGGLSSNSMTPKTFILFIVFSVGLILLYLSIALFVGSVSRNRWQALTISVSIWFFTVIGWQTILIAVLGLLPYIWVKPLLLTLTVLNPAELIRLFVVVKLGGGSVLGPEYYEWVQWIQQPVGTWIFLLILLIWITFSITAIYVLWERSKSYG